MNLITAITAAILNLAAMEGPSTVISYQADDHDTPASHGNLGERPNAITKDRKFSAGGTDFRSYNKGGLSYTTVR